MWTPRWSALAAGIEIEGGGIQEATQDVAQQAGRVVVVVLVAERLGRRRVLRVSPFTLRLAEPLVELPRPGPMDLERVLRRREQRLTGLCSMGPYHQHLPPMLRREALRRAADLDGVGAFLARAELREASPPEVPQLWLEL